MTTLEARITAAKTSKELERLVDSIKRQDNGFKNALALHLEDAFWYDGLMDNLEGQKEFMLKVSSTYADSFKTLK